MNNSTAAVILAAGLGTRFKSTRPKVLHSAGGRALIDHVVRATVPVVSRGIYAVVGYQAARVVQALQDAGHRKVHSVLQRKQLGTGHALLAGANQLRKAATTLLVVCGD